jgi:glycosyltransferase involved in cell wall biosynthesis
MPSRARKPRLLLLLHLPPPLHGASRVGEMIQNSKQLKSSFDCTFVSIATGGYGLGFNARWLANVLCTLWIACRALMRGTYDVIYITPTATGLSLYKDIPIALIAKARCSRVVYHFHNTGFGAYPLVPSWLKRAFVRNATLMLHSPRLAHDFDGYIAPNQVVYVPLGVESQAASERCREAQSHGPVRLLYLSNMMREKGVFQLLDALAMLDAQETPFECTFVGQWFDVQPSEFDAYVREKGLTNHVRSVGPRFGIEKQRVYADADIFVFPSLRESFGLVVLEAMSAAVPIIGTDVGAVREMLGNDEAGIVVEPGNPVAFADAIRFLLKSPERRAAMGASARNRFKRNYSIELFEEAFNRAILQVYAGPVAR